jgi:HEPN domain-containing protein
MSDPEVARLTDEWLGYAESDLASAEAMLSSRSPYEPRHVCFAAQQAAEKALKARYVGRQVQYPFIHDLAELANGLGTNAVDVDQLKWLTQWATAPRYPGDVEPEWSDAERAVAEARAIVEAAVRDIEAQR